jgi:hypothetical protein
MMLQSTVANAKTVSLVTTWSAIHVGMSVAKAVPQRIDFMYLYLLSELSICIQVGYEQPVTFLDLVYTKKQKLFLLNC